MPDNDSKFLKYKARVLAVNAGNTQDVLTSPITVKDYRGYHVGDTIPAGTKLIDIITKEFLSTAPTHTITITTVGQGTTDPSGNQSVTDGQNFTLNSATPTTGWKLKNVKLDGSVVTLPNTLSNVTRDHTYTVTFEELPPTPTYTVTPSAGANGSISPSTAQTFNENDQVNITFTATPNTGYEVNTWKLNGIDVQTGGNTFTLGIPSITSDQRVEVSFKDIPVVVDKYHVVVTDNTTGILGYGTITPAAGTHDINVGTDTTVTATAASGFKVKTLTLDGTAQTSPFTITGVKDQTYNVVVEFEKIPTGSIYNDAYIAASGRTYKEADVTEANVVLGSPMADPDTAVAQIKAGTFAFHTHAQAKSIETILIAKSLCRLTSIVQNGFECLNNNWYEKTMTFDGIDYWCYHNTTVGAGNTDYTLKGE